MKYKLSASTGVYYNYSLTYAISDLAALGYDGVEVWGGRPHMYRHDCDGEVNEMCAQLQRLSLGVSNFVPAQFRYPSVLCSENEMIRKESVDYIRIAVDNAAAIGSPSVSVCPGMTLWDKDIRIGRAQLRRSIEEIAFYADAKGISLLIEPAHPAETNHIRTVAECADFMSEVDAHGIGILLDVGHANINREPLAEVFDRYGDMIRHIHVNDNGGVTDDHRIPGDGIVDHASLYSVLDAADYGGYLSVELSPAYIGAPARSLAEAKGSLASMHKRYCVIR